MNYLENKVLCHTSYIGGEQLSVADIRAIWGVRWDLQGMTSQPPGLGSSTEALVDKVHFPKVWCLIESLPLPQPKVIDFVQARDMIMKSRHTSDVIGVMRGEATGLKEGAYVTVDTLGQVYAAYDCADDFC